MAKTNAKVANKQPKIAAAAELKALPAIVYFWDHHTVSAGIVLELGRPSDLATILRNTLHVEEPSGPDPWNPGQWACRFAWVCWDGGLRCEVRSAPPGRADTLGAQVTAIQAPAEICLGHGSLLIDIGADQLEVYGGGGLELLNQNEYNLYQVRRQPLRETIKLAIRAHQTPRRQATR